VAQGRIWTGKDALDRGLVDALGGVARAVAIAKRAADIPDGEAVTVLELSRSGPGLGALLGGGGAALRAALPALAALLQGQGLAAALGAAAAALSAADAAAALTGLPPAGQMAFTMDEVQLSAAGSVGGAASAAPSDGRCFLDDEGEDAWGGWAARLEAALDGVL